MVVPFRRVQPSRAARRCAGAWFLIFPLLLGGVSTPASATPEVFEGEYIVRLPRRAALSAAGATEETMPPSLRVQKELGDLTLVAPATAPLSLSSSSARRIVRFNPADSFCATLMKQGTVSLCEPNYVLRASVVPNDPSFGNLYGLREAAMNAEDAWEVTTGSREVVVAIIDTGIDYRHPDLKANLWTNTGEIPGNGRDDDGNGYIDDVHGMNALNRSGDPLDDNGHGTHVAGTIGAVGDNGLGVVGVNWQVSLLGLKFLDAEGAGGLADAIEAIDYMIALKQRGVNIRVSNNSWGGGGFSRALHDAIARARDAGIIFVAAAGNEGSDNDQYPSYPASYELSNVVSVAAIDADLNLASFSNFGAGEVDIAAPGVGILSTVPGGGYASYSGTSMATPHVAGLLALLLAHEKSLTTDGALSRLYSTGTSIPSLSGVIRTGRMANAARALRPGSTPPDTVPPTPEPIPCEYEATLDSGPIDSAADGGEVILQVDEFDWAEVPLPFAFPFHGRAVRSVKLSPNGVLYLQGGVPLFDYENGAAAPPLAIAALQTDWIPALGSHGVRIAVAEDRATFYWSGEHYWARGAGTMHARLTLEASGRVRSSINFETAALEEVVASQATMGIGAGPEGSGKATWGANSPRIRDGTRVVYTPQCRNGSDHAAVSSIALRAQGRGGAQLEAGRRFTATLAGSGSGSVLLGTMIGRRVCERSVPIELTGGDAVISGRVPPSRLTLFSGNVVASSKVRRPSRQARRVSASTARLCERLTASIRPLR